MKTFNNIALAIFALCLVSCEKGGKDVDLDSPLTITISKDIIQSDGKDYAEVTVRLNDEVIADDLTFYFREGDFLKPATKYVNGSRFSITEAGTYNLMARYGTFSTDPVKIYAIPVAVPDTPDDPLDSSLDFKTRALLIQFTGAACGNCPRAKTIMKNIGDGNTSVDPDSYVKIECHNFSSSEYKDKAQFATSLSDYYCSGYPNMNANLNYITNLMTSEEGVIEYISSAHENMSPKAGLAVNFSVSEGMAVLKVSVKAGVASEYRVGGVLLEDGVYSKQLSATETWMNTHNSCIRWMEAGKYYTGLSLDNMAVSEVKSHVFVWDLEAIASDSKSNPGVKNWDGINQDNLRAAAYVTMPSDQGKKGYIVVNAVETDSNNQEIPFEYND